MGIHRVICAYSFGFFFFFWSVIVMDFIIEWWVCAAGKIVLQYGGFVSLTSKSPP